MENPFLGKQLAAIDGSELGDYALNLATDIGEKFSSEIDILHVASFRESLPTGPIYDPIIGGPAMVPAPLPLSEANQAKIKEKEDSLLLERQRIVLNRNLKCNVISRTSDDIAGEILDVAMNGGYNLIVLGSRGLSGLKSFLLGSVSKKVAKEAKISVLIVSTRISKTPKFLLAYDGSDESKAALECAKKLGEKFGAQVDPIGVVHVPIATEGYIISGMDRWEKEMKQSIDEASAALKAQGIPSQGSVFDSGDVSRAISEAAKRGAYDLVIVGSRGYGRLKSLFLGSVAAGIADSAQTNVWIVR